MKDNRKLGLIGRKRIITHEEDKEKEVCDKEKVGEKVLCEVCKKEEYKYNCPKCLIKTCSAKCVIEHKKKYGCDGKKDPFRNVTRQEDYDEKVFLRDIKYMNNTLNEINMSNRKIYNLTEDLDSSNSKNFKTFKRILKKFRNINYFKSPLIMQCNKFNKCYSDPRSKKIFWTIKFNFIDETMNYIFDTVFDGDSTNLKNLIEYLSSNKQTVDKENVGILRIISDKNWNEKYNFYTKLDVFNLSLEDKNKNFYYKKYYYELCPLDKTINEILKGKNVYEFPEFYLIKK